MLVALAFTDGTPIAVSTGKLISVPPPASALTAPAPTAAAAAARWASAEMSDTAPDSARSHRSVASPGSGQRPSVGEVPGPRRGRRRARRGSRPRGRRRAARPTGGRSPVSDAAHRLVDALPAGGDRHRAPEHATGRGGAEGHDRPAAGSPPPRPRATDGRPRPRPSSGFLCSRRGPRSSCLKCFTAFVAYSASRSMPASSTHAPQHGAGRTDERSALLVLDVARLLTDEHEPGVRRSLSEHRLGRVLVERAPGAAGRRRCELGQVIRRRDERAADRSWAMSVRYPLRRVTNAARPGRIGT